jgi:plastocyanin
MKRLVLLSAVLILASGSMVFFGTSGQHHKSSLLAPDASQSSALSSATVSFGGWMANPHLCPPPNNTTPPAPCPIVDRFANVTATQFPRFSNHHELTPQIAKIKAGGTVNFIIGGLHVVAVYDDGTQPTDIDTTILVPDRPPMTPPIIDDAENRIYRGLDPFILPAKSSQDRVEVVQFDEPGTYLVICAVLPHFEDGMYGFVKVLPAGKE